MGEPISTQTFPRTRPSVPSIAIVLTVFSPEEGGGKGREKKEGGEGKGEGGRREGKEEGRERGGEEEGGGRKARENVHIMHAKGIKWAEKVLY